MAGASCLHFAVRLTYAVWELFQGRRNELSRQDELLLISSTLKCIVAISSICSRPPSETRLQSLPIYRQLRRLVCTKTQAGRPARGRAGLFIAYACFGHSTACKRGPCVATSTVMQSSRSRLGLRTLRQNPFQSRWTTQTRRVARHTLVACASRFCGFPDSHLTVRPARCRRYGRRVLIAN